MEIWLRQWFKGQRSLAQLLGWCDLLVRCSNPDDNTSPKPSQSLTVAQRIEVPGLIVDTHL
jgi:hypothetical protein